MLLIKKKNIIAFILALIITVGYLWSVVLTPPSAFNLLPYQIHESLKLSNSSESSFIRVFDICFTFVLFILSYISIYKLFAEIEQNKKIDNNKKKKMY